MNTNDLKPLQVQSTGNHQNKTDIKKTKSDGIDPTSCSGKNVISKRRELIQFCKLNAIKCFQDINFDSLKLSTDPGVS